MICMNYGKTRTPVKSIDMEIFKIGNAITSAEQLMNLAAEEETVHIYNERMNNFHHADWYASMMFSVTMNMIKQKILFIAKPKK